MSMAVKACVPTLAVGGGTLGGTLLWSVPDLGQILQDPAAVRGVGHSGRMEVLLSDAPADTGSDTSRTSLVR